MKTYRKIPARLVAVTLAFLLAAAGFAMTALAATEPLAWDALKKDYTAKQGDFTAHFFFLATNISAEPVTIDGVKASCGCTVPKIPSQPWHLAPGESGRIDVAVDLRGKIGTLFKTLTIESTNTQQALSIEVTIPPGLTNDLTPAMGDRLWTQEVAKADRQAVFKNDCVECHLVPAFGKSGEQLYHVTCGICHESPHRATMVPDLATLKMDVPDNYWRETIAHGNAGTLMPGFAATDGGPLDDQQIQSLVNYVQKRFPDIKKAEPPEDD